MPYITFVVALSLVCFGIYTYQGPSVGATKLSLSPQTKTKDIAFTNLEKETFETMQEEQKSTTGRYQAYAPDTIKKGTHVDEYIMPDQTVGYQVYEYELRDDGLYRRSFGKGGQAADLSYNWTQIWAATTTR